MLKFTGKINIEIHYNRYSYPRYYIIPSILRQVGLSKQCSPRSECPWRVFRVYRECRLSDQDVYESQSEKKVALTLCILMDSSF